MNKKFKTIIVLSSCILCLIIGGTIGLVSCDDKPADSTSDQYWTSNY